MNDSRDKAAWERRTLAPTSSAIPSAPSSLRAPSGLPLEPAYGPAMRTSKNRRPESRPTRVGSIRTCNAAVWWTMRPYAGFGTAEETNARFRFLRTTARRSCRPPSICDSDGIRLRQRAGRRRGRTGPASHRHARRHASPVRGDPAGGRLDSMTINATATTPCRSTRWSPRSRDSGAAAGDDSDGHPQGVHRARHVHLSAEASLRHRRRLVRWCAREMPRWNPISISGYHIREAGATAAQEIAFTFDDAIASM